jgi:transposase
MIGLPSGTRVWLASGITDLCRGFDGLSALVQTQRRPIRSAVTRLCFDVDAVICSRCCGEMARGCTNECIG